MNSYERVEIIRDGRAWMWNDSQRPMLLGIKNKEGDRIKVWCPYCVKWNYHGWNPGVTKDLMWYRTAHCDSSCPFSKSGYFIAFEESYDF